MISCCAQDCMVLLAPYPNNLNPVETFNIKTDFDLQGRFGLAGGLYEVNIWMWHYGRGRPGIFSIAEAERIRRERISESRTRAAETRKRHR